MWVKAWRHVTNASHGALQSLRLPAAITLEQQGPQVRLVGGGDPLVPAGSQLPINPSEEQQSWRRKVHRVTFKTKEAWDLAEADTEDQLRGGSRVGGLDLQEKPKKHLLQILKWCE